MIEENIKIVFTCSVCGNSNHKWHEIYYEEGAKLVKAMKSYITWCNKAKGYVIASRGLK